MNAVSRDVILTRIRDKRADVERFLVSATPLTMTLELTSPSWRLLCGAASVASIMATVATQVLKSNNLEQNIGRAQSARARLEVLETSVTLGQIEPPQAATEFLKCVEDAAFLER